MGALGHRERRAQNGLALIIETRIVRIKVERMAVRVPSGYSDRLRRCGVRWGGHTSFCLGFLVGFLTTHPIK